MEVEAKKHCPAMLKMHENTRANQVKPGKSKATVQEVAAGNSLTSCDLDYPNGSDVAESNTHLPCTYVVQMAVVKKNQTLDTASNINMPLVCGLS